MPTEAIARRVILVGWLVMAVVPRHALAQQTVAPHGLKSATVEMSEPWLTRLRAAAAIGDGPATGEIASRAVADLTHLKFATECCDLTRDHVLVFFTFTDAAGTEAVSSVLLHDPMPDSPTLPGLGLASKAALYQVFLTDAAAPETLVATYAVSREPNPAEKQLGDFVATIVGKIALPVSVLSPSGQALSAAESGVPTNPVNVSFSRVLLPWPGKIAVKAVVVPAASGRAAKPLTGTSTIGNSARVRYGFGLGVGYISSLRADRPRATIESGKIVADPIERPLAMAMINLTPWGYDPQTTSPTLAERVRLFIGPVLSPDFGVAGGVAFEVNRYLAVTAGYPMLWFDTPKAGEVWDEAPSTANQVAPFELASARAVFVGLSYNFK